MQHGVHKRVLAEVKNCLGLDAYRPFPCLLEVSMPGSQSIVPVVDGTAHGCRHEGVELDVGVAVGDERFYVTRVERLREAALEFDVLLGHA
jgi:hypothetical protein